MRVYHSQSQTTMTVRAAARALEVSRQTFQKWVKLGYVKLVEVGPGGPLSIRRVPVSEVERLRREA
jgi:predicted site-specific integrase-resolvase